MRILQTNIPYFQAILKARCESDVFTNCSIVVHAAGDDIACLHQSLHGFFRVLGTSHFCGRMLRKARDSVSLILPLYELPFDGVFVIVGVVVIIITTTTITISIIF